MYENPFHEDMSYPEALDVFYTEVMNTTDETRIEQLKQDYIAVIPLISARELGAGMDILTSYPVKE